MKVSNVKYYSDIDFAEYMAMPGVSYSSIKGFEGPPSAGMSLGTKVHHYILEPEKYVWEDVAQVKMIAAALRQYLGDAIDYLRPEVAVTADFIHNGLVMPYKGKIDLLKAGRLVVDLKVLSGPLQPAIQRFGYDKQLSGYCLATSSPMGLIVSFNKPKKIVETAIIKPDAEWWEYQVASRFVII
jgi:hypothetical protein